MTSKGWRSHRGSLHRRNFSNRKQGRPHGSVAQTRSRPAASWIRRLLGNRRRPGGRPQVSIHSDHRLVSVLRVSVLTAVKAGRKINSLRGGHMRHFLISMRFSTVFCGVVVLAALIATQAVPAAPHSSQTLTGAPSYELGEQGVFILP